MNKDEFEEMRTQLINKYGVIRTKDGGLMYDKKYEPIIWMIKNGLLRDPSKRLLDEYLREYRRLHGMQ